MQASIAGQCEVREARWRNCDKCRGGVRPSSPTSTLTQSAVSRPCHGKDFQMQCADDSLARHRSDADGVCYAMPMQLRGDAGRWAWTPPTSLKVCTRANVACAGFSIRFSIRCQGFVSPLTTKAHSGGKYPLPWSSFRWRVLRRSRQTTRAAYRLGGPVVNCRVAQFQRRGGD